MVQQPLNLQRRVVNPDGTPTQDFIRILQERASDANDVEATIAALQASILLKADKTTNIIAGSGLTGGGTLAADRTLNVGAGTGISVAADTVGLANTAVTPGAYTNANITVDAQGRITLAANGSAPAAFRGALVNKAADQTAANYTAGAVVAWDQEQYDTDSIHDNVTNNSRLTVPTGVTKVRLYGTISMSLGAAADWLLLRITKNGGAAVGLPFHQQEGGAATTGISVVSAIVPCVAGDYFELQFQVESDTSITVAANRSAFAMEIIA